MPVRDYQLRLLPPGLMAVENGWCKMVAFPQMEERFLFENRGKMLDCSGQFRWSTDWFSSWNSPLSVCTECSSSRCDTLDWPKSKILLLYDKKMYLLSENDEYRLWIHDCFIALFVRVFLRRHF